MIARTWFLGLLCMLALPGHAATVEYIHTDALGTPMAATDANRNVIERSEYEPYGALLNRPISDGLGYTGHVMDAATGLTYMQQRYYDPGLGRFLSGDPVEANSNTGANFNRYWYADNNPYRFVDPDGRQSALGMKREDMMRTVRSEGPVGNVSSGTGRLPPTASVRTGIKSQRTTFTVNGTVAGEWPSRNDVTKRALPGADGPYESSDVYPTAGPYRNNAKAFGPMGYLRRMTCAIDGSMVEAPDYRTPALRHKDGSPQWGALECKIVTFKSSLTRCAVLRQRFRD